MQAALHASASTNLQKKSIRESQQTSSRSNARKGISARSCLTGKIECSERAPDRNRASCIRSQELPTVPVERLIFGGEQRENNDRIVSILGAPTVSTRHAALPRAQRTYEGTASGTCPETP